MATRTSKYCTVRWHAEHRSIPFELAREDYNALVSYPCVFGFNSLVQPAYIGLDRIDNAKGYSKFNCSPCCSRHNWLRGAQFTFEEFMDAVQRYPGLRDCGDFVRKAKP